jgi:hypothetical protein
MNPAIRAVSILLNCSRIGMVRFGILQLLLAASSTPLIPCYEKSPSQRIGVSKVWKNNTIERAWELGIPNRFDGESRIHS